MFMDIAQRLEAALVEAGVKPHKVRSTIARICGIQPQSVHAWFQGATKQPSAENLEKVAAFYGLNLHWVITGRGDMYSTSADTEAETLALDLIRKLPPNLQDLALRQLQVLADTD